MTPESELESKPGLLVSELESELESHDAGIGIRVGLRIFGKQWNQNRSHLLLELESELESELVPDSFTAVVNSLPNTPLVSVRQKYANEVGGLPLDTGHTKFIW